MGHAHYPLLETNLGQIWVSKGQKTNSRERNEKVRSLKGKKVSDIEK